MISSGNIPKYMQPGLFKKKKKKQTPPVLKPSLRRKPS